MKNELLQRTILVIEKQQAELKELKAFIRASLGEPTEIEELVADLNAVVVEAVETYTASIFEPQLDKYKVKVELWQCGLIPMSYLTRRLSSAKEFKAQTEGSSEALKSVIALMVANNILFEAPGDLVRTETGFRGKCFVHASSNNVPASILGALRLPAQGATEESEADIVGNEEPTTVPPVLIQANACSPVASAMISGEAIQNTEAPTEADLADTHTYPFFRMTIAESFCLNIKDVNEAYWQEFVNEANNEFENRTFTLIRHDAHKVFEIARIA